MQPPLTFPDAQTQLALLTSQTANFTFNNDEMTQALTEAWQDDFNCVVVWDTSLVYSATTYQYTIPSGIDVVINIYTQKTTQDKPERIDSSLYEIVNGIIQFNPRADSWLMDSQTLQVKGRTKLTVDDELPTTQLINYVLYSAATGLLNRLVLKQAFVFLRNDISMNDITRAISTVSSQALRYKQGLLREFE